MEVFEISSSFSWTAYWLSNAFAVVLIATSKRYIPFTRLMVLLIFLAAAAVNTYIAIDAPWAYQDYADTAIPLYKKFILGAFMSIITPMVLTIAFCQLLIAISMFAGRQALKIGCWAGIIFCVSIAPLGLYAAFPATLLLAIALFRLERAVNPNVKPASKHLSYTGSRRTSSK
ncbi:hypothetical protein [Dyadobacter sp. BHUBP1]|uniref:hypothetical protein n=1 Tax=Dyadobacter sp. BHUBP1 TaxID=3424178 RepID=UPI003D3368B2